MKIESIKEVRGLIKEAKVDDALELLATRLEEGGAGMAEYLQTVHLLQAEFFQNKSNQIKGISSSEDIRMVNNRIIDNTLDVLQDLEAGQPMQKKQFSFKNIEPWRYYVVGGVVSVALMVFAWSFVKGGKVMDTCPDFGRKSEFKVMILPFLETGEASSQRPEFDIMDRLNDLAEKSSLRAEADVREGFDINADYPSPTRAASLARDCSVDMVVWGRVQQQAGDKIRLNVRYKVMNKRGSDMNFDSTINSLLIVNVDGNLQEDAAAISKKLFAVIGNAMRQPQVALAALSDYSMEEYTGYPGSGMDEAKDDAKSSEAGSSPVLPADNLPEIDTTLALMKAQSLWLAEDFDAAIKEYDKVIQVNPASKEALQNRGLLYYQKSDFQSAARDLESALVSPSEEDAPTMRLQTEAYIHTNQLEKAEKTIKKIKKMSKSAAPTAAWFDKTEKQLSEKRQIAEADRIKAEKLAARKKNTPTRLTAAQLNLDLGSNDNATTLADKILSKEPANLSAVKIKVEAELAVGDTTAVRKTLNSALKSGVQAREVLDWKPRVAPLLKPVVPKN